VGEREGRIDYPHGYIIEDRQSSGSEIGGNKKENDSLFI
jgi:hypothetical protein